MNWDRIEGQWKQRRGKAVRHWGKVMNDELAGVAGRCEQLVGQLQERYGKISEEAGDHIARFQETAEQLKRTNRKLMELLESVTGATKSAGLKKAKQKRTPTRPAHPFRKRKKLPSRRSTP